MSDLRCVVVTPEQTELDVTADSITVPLFDGEMGILKGHSPLVGRLGYGALNVKNASQTDSYFIEGGFVQVSENVVSVLTDKLVPLSDITAQAASDAMQAALAMPMSKPEDTVVRTKAVSRAQAMTRVAG
ncbi:ATP synthase F1 subunit epsilon [Aureliella helgolandensis]|uniref:ATP synthase epsilon chain n=1 Tax=Aureliella helgolandensis TaxID=2527968 RepID=A0A518GEB0_9BACT|nr:ATP synthase F1 subunit epsilon [Aureliella helgolandensis]QDV26887.1 ATP synthase epsilon chain, sodium ion specific [Aureliella helgolandensis]